MSRTKWAFGCNTNGEKKKKRAPGVKFAGGDSMFTFVFYNIYL